MRDTGNLEIAHQEIRGLISNWEEDTAVLSKQLVEFVLNEFSELLYERQDLEAILLSVIEKYKPVFKKTNLQADADFFKRLQKISKEKGIDEKSSSGTLLNRVFRATVELFLHRKLCFR